MHFSRISPSACEHTDSVLKGDARLRRLRGGRVPEGCVKGWHRRRGVALGVLELPKDEDLLSGHRGVVVPSLPRVVLQARDLCRPRVIQRANVVLHKVLGRHTFCVAHAQWRRLDWLCARCDWAPQIAHKEGGVVASLEQLPLLPHARDKPLGPVAGLVKVEREVVVDSPGRALSRKDAVCAFAKKPKRRQLKRSSLRYQGLQDGLGLVRPNAANGRIGRHVLFIPRGSLALAGVLFQIDVRVLPVRCRHSSSVLDEYEAMLREEVGR
mmetsp:Transcript_26372/g.76648  ORF Transcript_26372/g.76648 Transcript_26372/m.76648 type:complete len:268 (-) Transcript_26372:539-1342(-)